MLGDATLFTRADEVDEQWALVDAIVSAWKRTGRRSRTTGRELGAADRGRSAPSRRAVVEAALSIVAQVERQLAELRLDEDEGRSCARA